MDRERLTPSTRPLRSTVGPPLIAGEIRASTSTAWLRPLSTVRASPIVPCSKLEPRPPPCRSPSRGSRRPPPGSRAGYRSVASSSAGSGSFAWTLTSATSPFWGRALADAHVEQSRVGRLAASRSEIAVTLRSGRSRWPLSVIRQSTLAWPLPWLERGDLRARGVLRDARSAAWSIRRWVATSRSKQRPEVAMQPLPLTMKPLQVLSTVTGLPPVTSSPRSLRTRPLKFACSWTMLGRRGSRTSPATCPTGRPRRRARRAARLEAAAATRLMRARGARRRVTARHDSPPLLDCLQRRAGGRARIGIPGGVAATPRCGAVHT